MALEQGATNAFATGLMNGVYNFTSGSFKMALYTGQQHWAQTPLFIQALMKL
jgi:hypothetical protein